MAKSMLQENASSSNLPVRHNNGEMPAVRDTALSAWNPWREFDLLNRWFDDFMGRPFSAALSPRGMMEPLRESWTSGAATVPAIDLYETPEEIALFAYCPGAKRDAFDISLGNETITIQGERESLIGGESLRGYGSGFAQAQGVFEASCNLPCKVNADQVKATYRDGVLEIRLPKAESARVRTVKVQVEDK